MSGHNKEQLQAREAFVKIFKQELFLAEAWTNLIDVLEVLKPKSYWRTIRDINIEADRQTIKGWLESIFIKDEITETTKCLWINIMENNEPNSPKINGFDLSGYNIENLYLIGHNQLSFSPESTFIEPIGLIKIEQEIKHKKDDYNFMDWLLPLAYCSFILDDIIRIDLDRRNILKFKQSLIVGVGYYDGDYMKLSPIV